MSPVVRVRPAAPGPDVPLVPFRVTLRLDELVLAARIADLPLPVRTDRLMREDRFSDRLAGTPASEARAVLAAALARVEDDGPDGARASLTARGLLGGDTVDVGVVAALSVLAAGPLGALLDVALVRAEGDLRLRSWFGAAPSTVAQLSTTDGLEHELAWFAPALWVSQVTRAVSVEPWVPRPAPLALPDFVSLPSELLAGSEKAHRERRADLVPALAATYAGRVRLGDARAVRAADPDEVLRLLSTLGTATRGRLRMATRRRDREDADPAVASWLLLDDGWHELRPGRDATAVLRRRDAHDLGLLSRPAVAAVTEVAA
ncbi:hypothetical protein ACT8ZV_01680 [Nocardioides sp. MAHUQ-72]|uniref:hypothetical protein n=1 Tax=unclassified Nocardioides TaxID=2615069 RepID=UPI003605CDBB